MIMKMNTRRTVIASALLALLLAPLRTISAAPRELKLSQSAQSVEAYDFVEATIQVAGGDAANPFTDVAITGAFGKAGESARTAVAGFCDSKDGSVYRIRFMPSTPGDFVYSVAFRQGDFEKTFTGKFRATDGHRRGAIRVDPKYPWHFIWEGTGEHYFFNGTTAFWLMGWREDRVIDFSIERLLRLKVNRLRCVLAGSANRFYGEPVMLEGTREFTYSLRPWVSQRPNNFEDPGHDYTRFDLAYWQKWDRMLKFSRDRDMIISVILYITTEKVRPDPGSEDERRYFRYAAARLGAFSNITWDLGDDYNAYRTFEWAHEMGTFLMNADPYRHLITTHPLQHAPLDRTSEWFGFTSIQDWRRPQHPLMLSEREAQRKTGRIIPQANEEYGYEDHYPKFAPAPPGDSAEVLRHMAWEIAMAGAYGTAGETAKRGVNIWPDTGGGWINGRGDDTMTMLNGYAHMVEFFTSFEWWKTDPHDELVDNGAYCLALPGEIYAVYLPNAGPAGKVTVQLAPGNYTAKWFSAFTGEVIPLPPVSGGKWTSPVAPGWLDWALLLVKEKSGK
jgi:hypothetical protein